VSKCFQQGSKIIAATSSAPPGMAIVSVLPGGILFMTYVPCGPWTRTMVVRARPRG
jgi:hypothetical protein